MVEVLLARALTNAGISAQICSAGLLDLNRGASDGAQEVMTARGLDLGGHRSTQITRELVASSDLVIGLARQHVREAVVLDFSAFPRTFTLKELVRRGRERGGQRAGEGFDDWLQRLHEGRIPSEHLGVSPDDDVADPIGQRLAVYERTAKELVELVDAFTAMIVPARPTVVDLPLAHLDFTAARTPEDFP